MTPPPEISARRIHLLREIEKDDLIPNYFAGKNILVTGASGFMGKVLIEKLLRSCPDIGNIYILLRLKTCDSLETRLKGITNNVLYDTVRKSNPDAFKKIVPIEGDIKELNLGISDQDRAEIIENVSIVYHVAATVRFDETLAESILMNTRGTREVCNLVLALKRVDVFLHVSTAYCQHDKKIVEEKTYPPPADWRKMIKIVENTDQYTMKIMSAKVMNNFPNTYTYAKALAEAVIKDLCESKVPTIIIRPTIVISIFRDPMPGWNDNMNGPVGLIAASAKGILRSNYVNYDAKLDFVSVDFCIAAFIKATWLQQYLNPKEIAVYNCSSQDHIFVDALVVAAIGNEVVRKVTPQIIFYPNFFTTDNKLVHVFNVYLFHLIPAVIIDSILRFLKKPPQLLKLQRRIFLTLGCLDYFVRNQWVFHNHKFFALDAYLNGNDRDNFNIDLNELDYTEYFTTAAKVGMELVLKEDLSNLENNQRNMKRLGYIHNFLKYSSYLLITLALYYYLVVPCAERFVIYLTNL